MTIDTSAILAILLDEPERVEFVSLIEGAPRRVISAVSVLEAGMVLETRKGPDAEVDLDGFLRRGEIEVIGDCASYALACWLREPLLFKGRDFTATDIACVKPRPA